MSVGISSSVLRLEKKKGRGVEPTSLRAMIVSRGQVNNSRPAKKEMWEGPGP